MFTVLCASENRNIRGRTRIKTRTGAFEDGDFKKERTRTSGTRTSTFYEGLLETQFGYGPFNQL